MGKTYRNKDGQKKFKINKLRNHSFKRQQKEGFIDGIGTYLSKNDKVRNNNGGF